jgi:hypothetical protein
VSAGTKSIKYVALPDAAAYTRCVSIDPGAAVVAARRALSMARDDLDQAVAETPEIDPLDAIGGVEAMASPGLLALLLRAVKARNHLEDVVSSAKR